MHRRKAENNGPALTCLFTFGKRQCGLVLTRLRLAPPKVLTQLGGKPLFARLGGGGAGFTHWQSIAAIEPVA